VKDLLEVSEDRQQTAKKPFALELRFGDSDSEETREHRKARMVCLLLMSLSSAL